MDNYSARWLEIQFYTACMNIFLINNDMSDMMDYIDYLRIFNKNLQAEPLKYLASLMFQTQTIVPSRPEQLYLMKHMGYTVQEICKALRISKRDYYKLDFETPPIYPRLKESYHLMIKDFIAAQNRWKEGIL